MGKRLKQQVRGRATPRYVVPDHIAKVKVQLPPTSEELIGEVIDIVDDPARRGLAIKVKTSKGIFYFPAVEGISVGREIKINTTEPKLGNVLALKDIPDGSYITFLEKTRFDGGKFLRSPGAYAILLSKDDRFAYVKMPSRKVVPFPLDARAMLGVIAGGGFKDKPLLKAGHAYYKMRRLHRIWPRNRGVKMSPYDHPHGGKQHHVGKPTTVARNAPPGQKVGHIAARQTGRRKSGGK